MKMLATILVSLAASLPSLSPVAAAPMIAVSVPRDPDLTLVAGRPKNHQTHGRDDYYDDPNQTGWLFSMIVTGTLFDPDRALPTYTPPHQAWCYRHYRSYRATDNTFQPTRGPRKVCLSPYSR